MSREMMTESRSVFRAKNFIKKTAAPPLAVPPILAAPAVIEAEQCLLGAMLLDPGVMAKWAFAMTPEDFYRETHRALFCALRQMASRDTPSDNFSVLWEIQQTSDMEAVGGIAYLTSLYDVLPTASNHAYYAEIVLSEARKRKVARAALEVLEAVSAGATSEEVEILSESLVINSPLVPSEYSLTAKMLLRSLSDKIDAASENNGSLLGIPSGFAAIDTLINGLQGPDLILIGARPSVGKSALMSAIASHTATTGHPTLMFSMEMSGEQQMLRMVCQHGLLDSRAVRSGRLSAEEWTRYAAAVQPLYSAPLTINDSSGVTPGYMRGEIRRFIRQHGRVGLVCVDYFQLMKADRSNHGNNRFQELTEISIELKNIAREFNIPLLVLSQLSRDSVKRDNKRPVLSDLRETGQLEQDADIIAFLHREDMVNGTAPATEEESRHSAERKSVELLFRKHRNGPCRTIHLDFVEQFTLFCEHDPDAPTPI